MRPGVRARALRVTSKARFLVLLGALVWPAVVSAADAKKDDETAVLGQAPPPKFNEIERGFWMSVEAAPIAHMDWVTTLPPTVRQLLPDDAGLGFRAGVRGGYDILGLVSLDGYFLGQFREKRIRRGRSGTGDLSDFSAGASLRLMPITIRDRLSFTGRASVGFAFLLPGEVARANSNPGCIIPESGTSPITWNPLCIALPGIKTPTNPLGWTPFPPHVIAYTPTAEIMLGMEYFTHLRHFSVGVDLVLGAMLWPFQLHTGVVPHVKYSF